MAWHLKGQMLEICSCKSMCPCWLGPAEADQGWCSGLLAFNIQEGNSDGVNLGGTKVVSVNDWPKDFASGNGTGRVYIDETTSPEQRRELEAIFTCKKGGSWGTVFGAVVTKWLDTKVARIEIRQEENPSLTVGSVVQGKWRRLRDQAGRQTKVLSAPVASALEIEAIELARSDGSQCSDPEMRRWQSGGEGSIVSEFRWRG